MLNLKVHNLLALFKIDKIQPSSIAFAFTTCADDQQATYEQLIHSTSVILLAPGK